MQVQRVGISLGEGPAQVLDFPEASKALEFGRKQDLLREKAEIRDKRDKRLANEDRIDKMLAKLSDNAGWMENPEMAEKLHGLTNTARDRIYELAPRIANGDLAAMREAQQLASEVKAESQLQTALKTQYTSGLTNAKANPGEYSDEQIDALLKFGAGEMSLEEIRKKDPYWMYGDQPDIEGLMKEFRKTNAGLLENEISQFVTMLPGLAKATITQQAEDYGDELEGWINESEKRQMAITKMMSARGSVKGEEISDFIELEKARVTKGKEEIYRNYSVSRTKPPEKPPEKDETMAETLYRDAQLAATSGDPSHLVKHLAGLGYEIELGYDDQFQLLEITGSGKEPEKKIKIDRNDVAGLVKIVKDVAGYGAEAIDRGSKFTEGQVQTIKAKVDEAITALEGVGDKITPDQIAVLNQLPGVKARQKELSWFEFNNVAIITIEGQEYEMDVEDDRKWAVKEIRRRAAKMVASSFQDTVTPDGNATEGGSRGAEPKVITNPSQLPD